MLLRILIEGVCSCMEVAFGDEYSISSFQNGYPKRSHKFLADTEGFEERYAPSLQKSISVQVQKSYMQRRHGSLEIPLTPEKRNARKNVIAEQHWR